MIFNTINPIIKKDAEWISIYLTSSTRIQTRAPSPGTYSMSVTFDKLPSAIAVCGKLMMSSSSMEYGLILLEDLDNIKYISTHSNWLYNVSVSGTTVSVTFITNAPHGGGYSDEYFYCPIYDPE